MIAIGKITKSVGIKGEMRVQLLTDRPDRFKELKKVWLGAAKSQGTEHTIEASRATKAGVVLKLSGIETREDAEERKDQYVFISDEEAVLTPGSFFIHDVIGMKVVTEEGIDAGTIEDIVRMPAGDMWVVRKGGQETMIPGVKEFIRAVDVKRRLVVIRAIEGLLQ